MIVFGAGASYDSSPDYKPSDDGRLIPSGVRPPLANQLFELRTIFAEAAERIPKCLAIIHELRYRQSDSSVEQQLEKLRERALNYPEGQRQLLAIRFYLQWIIWGCQKQWNATIGSETTYRPLLGQVDRQLKGGSVCFVTFNYDTLLEEAFASLDTNFESLDDYVSRSDYRVIKLHGSVNWAHELTSSMQVPAVMLNQVYWANNAIINADKLETSNKYHLIPEEYRRDHIVSFMSSNPGKSIEQTVFPAIAIPLEKKREYECPIEHVRMLEECIPKTDKLLIVGWKAAEENFVRLLAQGLSQEIPIMVVSGSKASSTNCATKLREAGIQTEKWHCTEGGFTDIVRSGQIEDFVRS